ncbi:MAG TPA: flagellar assembly protein FliW [Clostridiales bacterium]|nr:MAG: hypothetical protein A2Y18_00190 [Clostridiales bacterium GWD2_32_19]HCC06927.1 flagellar assembly protein FliW [Clostridiales bacterium]
MMVQTRHFGQINVEEDKIINFRDGMPGFTNMKNYVLLTNEENQKEGPFFWLQSVEDGDVAFALVNPHAVYPDYSPEVKDEYVDFLGHTTAADLSVFNVVVVPEDIKDMTVNLRAPILINQTTKRGAQVISENQEYAIRQYLYQDMEQMKKKFEEGGK